MQSEIEALRARLDAYDEEFERLVHAVSHDLKQPIVGILGFATILQEDLAGRLDAEQQHFFDRILENGRKMERLLDGLLRLSRAGRLVDKDSRVALGPVLDEVVTRLQESVMASGAVIRRSPRLPEQVRGSVADVSGLFYELIANAIDFRREGRPTEIEVGVGEPLADAPGSVHLFVRDNGIGMAARHLDDVFQACRKLLPNCHDRLGVGLTICRKIIERYGEQIWIESTPDLGTTVHFTWTT